MEGATCEATVQVQTAHNAAGDAIRARELYKYYRPTNTLSASRFDDNRDSGDSVLRALSQLVAWRLNVQRALISLIDRETQYFVAESTKTLGLEDSTQYDDPDDAIWAGCTSVPKAGRLCEHTINTIPKEDGSPACFEVLDMTKDTRFNQLPFVEGHPYFKYYCGVPIRTKKGVNIGSLFALDIKAREPISETNKIFLADMANNIMTHLEMVKEKEERKRALNMNMCLAAFVDPEHQSGKIRRPSPSKGSRRGSDRHSVADAASVHSSRSDSDRSNQQRVEDDDHLNTFKRAAHLLYNSLSLEGGGGVVFLDTMTSLRGDTRDPDYNPGGWNISENIKGEVHFDKGLVSDFTNKSTSVQNGQGRVGNENAPRKRGVTSVLGSFGSESTWDGSHRHQTEHFKPLVPSDLMKLIKRHPRGKLFTLDTVGFYGSSSSGDDTAPFDLHLSRKNFPSEGEASLLLKHFPGARQVVFLPLWDSTSSRWSACFVYNTYEFHDITHNPDYLYCIAFTNCVMTEIARLATLAADQQKSDFIGSISHELRSPLHGILASCEFLSDTDCTSFQQSLVDTADSCARTLLDTINMVLDYSRINAFERNASKARKSARRGFSNAAMGGAQTGMQPLLNIFGDVDLAAITEEVVEGVSTGQVFKDFTTVESADLPINHRSKSIMGGTIQRAVTDEVVQDSSKIQKANVEIIIDIVARNWKFVTQPGAFRRIVMNLFGNSLKYTKQGYITVKLEAQDVEKPDTNVAADRDVSTCVTLTVTDTGQGISPEYMRTKLFTPFSQENSLNPGTGLGLSLVKGIINTLNGEITIKSTLGVGTEVIVKLPMSSSSSRSSSTTPSSAGSAIERVRDDSMSLIQRTAGGRTVAFFSNDQNKDGRQQLGSTHYLRTSMMQYFLAWFGYSIVSHYREADIILTNEIDLSALFQAMASMGSKTPRRPIILVFCANTSRLAASKVLTEAAIVEFVCLPVGPYKLARTIRVGLETLKKQETPNAIPENVLSDCIDVVEPVVTAMEEVRLATSGPSSSYIPVLKQGSVLANKDSSNAQMAMDARQVTKQGSGNREEGEFPFPPAEHDNAKEFGSLPAKAGVEHPPLDIIDMSPTRTKISSKIFDGYRPALETRKTLSPTRTEISAQEPPPTSSMNRAGAITTAPTIAPIIPASPVSNSRPPRLLLVDDNAVNLRLLETFMKKRKYTNVTSAMDGAQAVSIFRSLIHEDPPYPPDIIFMDISMPVLDGFAATRQIREIEAEVAQHLPPTQTPAPSLIIALTGLASGRDQSEAFVSGFDLYMTKPVSFREVGRLLDNWQANGGVASVTVPHGSVSGMD